mmetsp:Transcript_61052/g.181908  ORF Transcript_61052/g.181908 Transcript_61052/m.181908 type:complete len:244 (+) Transcript_61052:701-1432(+)
MTDPCPRRSVCGGASRASVTESSATASSARTPPGSPGRTSPSSGSGSRALRRRCRRPHPSRAFWTGTRCGCSAWAAARAGRAERSTSRAAYASTAWTSGCPPASSCLGGLPCTSWRRPAACRCPPPLGCSTRAPGAGASCWQFCGGWRARRAWVSTWIPRQWRRLRPTRAGAIWQGGPPSGGLRSPTSACLRRRAPGASSWPSPTRPTSLTVSWSTWASPGISPRSRARPLPRARTGCAPTRC